VKHAISSIGLCLVLCLVFCLVFWARAAGAELSHDAISGVAISEISVDGVKTSWPELRAPKKPATTYAIRFEARGSVGIPHCNGRGRILVDGDVVDSGSKGPRLLSLDEGVHAITIEVKASTYEKRIACSGPPQQGALVRSLDGLTTFRFPSPHGGRGGGEAVVFVPGGHDRARPAAVLVGTHPWNGTPWTYAAYEELLDEAGKRDVLLLMPSGLGNSLYVADAEDEVLRAIDALAAEIAIDPQRISIWGASMGGAGATTIAFHHPDRFAFVASWFGDSRYDLTTYVRGVLGNESGARRVNALDVLENARHLPVLLVHGEDDRSSPVRQSTMLEEAMTRAGFTVELRRIPGRGHEGPLVVEHVRDAVDRAAEAIAPRRPSRVSFRSVRAQDVSAYGVQVEPPGDAFVDVERTDAGIVVHAAEGVRSVVLAPDALGASPGTPIVKPPPPGVVLRW
jgi:pimeloyl-ACP methyl ester carboxylesterase